MTPSIGTSPLLGLIPTKFEKEAGDQINPAVSDPGAIMAKLAVTAAAKPELEPEAEQDNK